MEVPTRTLKHLTTALAWSTCISSGCAFQPTMMSKRYSTMRRILTQRHAFKDLDPVNELDLIHAHECAENFGKCDVAEMEEMQQALKTERLQHAALGLILDPPEEVDHRLLEQDLTLQLALLKDEMNTAPLYNVKKQETAPMKPPSQDNVQVNPVAAIANPEYYHKDHTLRDYVEQGEELFLMPNGLAETFAFGAALLIIGAASMN